MKFIISLILIALLSVAACLYLPWWSIAVVSFAVSSLIPQQPGKSFLTGFVAILLLWGSLAWFISSNNNHLLANKVSMIILKIDSPFMLIAATALIGALVAGFAALSGSYLRRS
jgi:hypothetical protein